MVGIIPLSFGKLYCSHAPYLFPPSRELTLNLVSIPNTRKLAEAQVDEIDDVDVAEVVDSHVLKKDVVGLVAAVLATTTGIIVTGTFCSVIDHYCTRMNIRLI